MNIPNSEGIAAVKAACESYPEKTVATKATIFSSDSYIKQLHVQLQKVLTNNWLRNGDSFAPKLCKYIYGKILTETYSPLIKGKVDLYLKYIDEIFFIWKGTEEELKNFFNEINKKHRSIKFDQKYLRSKIKFLDVLIYKNEQQNLDKTLFKKNTDNLVFMQNSTTQCYHRVKCCVSKESIQQTANSSVIVKYCKNN